MSAPANLNQVMQSQVTQGGGQPLDQDPQVAGGYPGADVPEDIKPALPPRPASSEATKVMDAMPNEFKSGNKGVDQSKINALGMEILTCINLAKSDRDPYLNRVARNESLYRNRPRTAVGKKPYAKATAHHIPNTGPKLEQRKAQLVNTLTTPDKFFTLQKLGQSEEAKILSEFLQWNLDNAGWDFEINDLADLGMYANQSMLRVDFLTSPNGYEKSNVIGPYAGLKHDVIHPEFFLVHPANHPSLLDSAAFVGHEFEMRVADVKAKQSAKIWLEGAVTASPQSLRMQRKNRDLQSDSGGSTLENHMVRLYDGLIRWSVTKGDKYEEKVYRVIGDAYSSKIYRIEEYSCPYCCYIPFRFKKDLNAFWCEDSPANDGQSIQLMINDIVNTVKWAIEYNTRPTYLTQDVTGQDSTKDVAPGTGIPTQNPGNVTQLQTTFNLAGVFDMVNLLIQTSDMALKVPNTMSAAPAAVQGETATAENIKAQAFQLMGLSDIKMWLPSLHQYAKLALWILGDNFADLWKTYGESGVFKLDDVRELRLPCRVFVAGQKPSSAPQMQMQEMLHLTELAQLVPEVQDQFFNIVIMYIGQTSIDGKEEIIDALKKVKEQEEQMAAAVAQAQQQAAQSGQPIEDPEILAYLDKQNNKQLSGMRELITMAYKDMPPDVQRQAEKMFGFKPSEQAPAQVDMTNKGEPR